jgi:hypothetical protein
MSNKRIILINFVPYIILTLLSCGEDKIIFPEVQEPAIKLPELMPLAKGAHWKYDFTYYKYDWQSDLWYSYEFHFGSLEINITNEVKSNKSIKYTMETHFKVDRSILAHAWETISSGIDTLYNALDTTLVYDIVLAKDTLWYYERDSLKYMMPRAFIPGSGLNLKIFSCSRSKPPDILDYSPYKGGSSSINYFNYYVAEGSERRVLIDKKAGITSIEASYNIGGGISSEGSIIGYLLTEYLPGVQ